MIFIKINEIILIFDKIPYFGRKKPKNRKIRDSHSIKNPLNGIIFFYQIKKSSIAAEKKINQYKPLAPLRDSKLYSIVPLRDSKMMDLADSLLVPNHQNPGSELESSKPVQVACLV